MGLHDDVFQNVFRFSSKPDKAKAKASSNAKAAARKGRAQVKERLVAPKYCRLLGSLLSRVNGV
eukprot:7588666-Lingulodinium_polyedra.AAC.1